MRSEQVLIIAIYCGFWQGRQNILRIDKVVRFCTEKIHPYTVQDTPKEQETGKVVQAGFIF